MDLLTFLLVLSIPAGFLYALYRAIYDKGYVGGRKAGPDERPIWTGQEDPPPGWRR